jgi:putative ABC transport system permease protein
MLAGVLALLQGLLVLVFAVGSLGVVNTLTMNVLEQTRELGLLRAVGMTAGQVRRFVRGQALVFALVSVPPGIIGGLVLAVLFDVAVAALVGLRTSFQLDLPLVGVCIGLAVLTAFLSAVLPARRAGRLKVFEALAYE